MLVNEEAKRLLTILFFKSIAITEEDITTMENIQLILPEYIDANKYPLQKIMLAQLTILFQNDSKRILIISQNLILYRQSLRSYNDEV